MSFAGVYVAIGTEIIYYNENDRMPGTIACDDGAQFVDVECELKSLSQSEERWEVEQNALGLRHKMQNENGASSLDGDSNNTITFNLSFLDRKEEEEWKFHAQTKLDIVIGVIVQHPSVEQDEDDEHDMDEMKGRISSFLDAMFVSIQKLFISSERLPVYILRLRCHLLTEKLVFSANHTRCQRACHCCSRTPIYHERTDSNLLDAHWAKQNEVEMELQRIKAANTKKKRAKQRESMNTDTVRLDILDAAGK